LNGRRLNMTRILTLILLAATQDRRPPEGVSVEKDLVYASPDGKDLGLDLYRKESADKRPAVVCVHGGGWRGGNKQAMAGLCGMLAAEGYVAVSINYRLSGDAKYPAQIQDCQEAVRWLRRNAEKYGVDPERIGALGKSAGAHLAALLGVKAGEGCRIQAVVSYFGPHDLNATGGGNQSATFQLIGASRNDKPEIWKDARCSTHVTADDPPVLMIHGDKDATVPLSQSETFQKRLRETGVEAELVVVRGGGHGLRERDASPSPRETDRKVLDFLARHLKGPASTKE
jgi:acetyl esterase/lipase